MSSRGISFCSLGGGFWSFGRCQSEANAPAESVQIATSVARYRFKFFITVFVLLMSVSYGGAHGRERETRGLTTKDWQGWCHWDAAV